MEKEEKFPIIYLIGSLLVVIGFICPMFKGGFCGKETNGFKLLDFDTFGTTTIAGLMIFCGGGIGAIVSVTDEKHSQLLKVVCIFTSIFGGILLYNKLSENLFSRITGKNFFNQVTYGCLIIYTGWVVGLIGAIKNE